MANRVFVYLKTTAPTTGDDTNAGYKVGDGWYDTTNDKIYKAIDVTPGAAIWDRIDVDNASTTLAGIIEIATTAEIDTASDNTRAISPGQFRASKFATQRKAGVVANPNSYYTNVRAQVPIFRTDAAITITRIHIHGADTTPTTELAGDLKFADDLNTGGFANAAVIDVCDTTSGVFTATSSFDDATVPSGKYVYFQMDAAPHADWKDFYIEVYYTYD